MMTARIVCKLWQINCTANLEGLYVYNSFVSLLTITIVHKVRNNNPQSQTYNKKNV